MEDEGGRGRRRRKVDAADGGQQEVLPAHVSYSVVIPLFLPEACLSI